MITDVAAVRDPKMGTRLVPRRYKYPRARVDDSYGRILREFIERVSTCRLHKGGGWHPTAGVAEEIQPRCPLATRDSWLA